MTEEVDHVRIQADILLFNERCMSQSTLDVMPEAIGIYRVDGLLIAYNEQFRLFWKLPQEYSLIGKINLLTAPGVHPRDVELLRRAIEGECGTSPVQEIDLRADPTFEQIQHKQLWMQTLFIALRVDDVVRYVMIIFRDCTEDMANKARIRENEAQMAHLQATIDELQLAQEKIRHQQDTIRELSTPIIEVWPGVLTMPLVGHVDERRASEMTERLLANLVDRRAHSVIIDLTGVERLDEATAGHIVRMLQAVPLLGVEPIITGIHASVAQSMIALNLDLHAIRILGSLRSALLEILSNRDMARARQPGREVRENPRGRKNGP